MQLKNILDNIELKLPVIHLYCQKTNEYEPAKIITNVINAKKGIICIKGLDIEGRKISSNVGIKSYELLKEHFNITNKIETKEKYGIVTKI